jgi:hypothetical protein
MAEPALAVDDPATTGRENPWVGPRPVRADELFFGRAREAVALINTLISGRVVLLHSPSGAGKTSLVQNSTIPAFARRDFQICVAASPASAPLRVNLPPPPDVEVPNRYAFSVVNGLVGHLLDRSQALTMSIADALDVLGGSGTPPPKQLVVIDQLEEILRLDPGDFEGRRTFFRQLGEALDHDRRWGLLLIREDYMGGLDPFLRYVPGQLRSTFRLDFLTPDAALEAVREPPRRRQAKFEDGAAEKLVSELRRVHADPGQESGEPMTYPYVEPVLLQVVCYSLWRKVARRRHEGERIITVQDVTDFLPFTRPLSKYYREVVQEAAADDPAVERAIRDWIDLQLIGKQGIRRPTRSTPAVPDPGATLGALQARYLIRDDPRPGGTWWELSHDRLIVAAREDNREWRRANLAPWQVAAYEWERDNHDSRHLLRGAAYRAAGSLKRTDLTTVEQAFLKESRKLVAAEGQLSTLEDQVATLEDQLSTRDDQLEGLENELRRVHRLLQYSACLNGVLIWSVLRRLRAWRGASRLRAPGRRRQS